MLTREGKNRARLMLHVTKVKQVARIEVTKTRKQLGIYSHGNQTFLRKKSI